jgi:hypothetical protein
MHVISLHLVLYVYAETFDVMVVKVYRLQPNVP